jgi:uncharacterized membrane protein YebE (DUF533 family)
MKGNKDDNKDDRLARTLHRAAALIALILCVVAGVLYWNHRSGQTPSKQQSEVLNN